MNQPRPYGLNPTFLAQVLAWVLVTKHGHDPYSSSQMPLPLPFFMRVELARPMRLEHVLHGTMPA